MIQPVPQVQRVIEEQESDDDTQRARERYPSQQPDPPALGETLDWRDNRYLARRRRRRCQQSDGEVPPDALESRLFRSAQRPQTFDDEKRADGDAEREPFQRP